MQRAVRRIVTAVAAVAAAAAVGLAATPAGTGQAPTADHTGWAAGGAGASTPELIGWPDPVEE